MRSALAQLLRRSSGKRTSAPKVERLLPFPLALPAITESHPEPSCSGVERAFYEGSVMIW